MTTSNNFRVFNASAGSGKTYSLVRIYLKILLQQSKPGNYREILAITFTNKAVNEMKTRILSKLLLFSQEEKIAQKDPMFRDLKASLGISAQDLQQRAQRHLKHLLHHYAFFEVSTIDKFTNRVVRTFAKDLQLPQNFEVILDTSLLLDEAVDALISKIGETPKLTEILLQFVFSKIEDDKSWNIKRQISEKAKLLFDEDQVIALEGYSKATLEDFEKLQQSIQQRIASTTKEKQILANQYLQLLADQGLEHQDFSNAYFPNFLLKAAQGQGLRFGGKWQNFESRVYPKRVPASKQAIIDGLLPQFRQAISQFQSLEGQHILLLSAQKEINPLSVIWAVAREIKKIEIEREEIPLAFFNRIIAKEIKDQPAPFIYERLGERFKHFFIDEFQDTSSMQWENLIPLIGNALEGNEIASLLLVGDPKQSIYRFRGGKAEQFIDLYQGSSQPFQLEVTTTALNSNYRSSATIVEFNNAFFEFASSILQDPNYANLYANQSAQNPINNKTGFVQIQYCEDAPASEMTIQAVALSQTLEQLLANGHNYGDICILCRRKKHLDFLAAYLSDANIPIISSESLLLSSQPKIHFIIDLLSAQLHPLDAEAQLRICRFLFDQQNIETDFFVFAKNALDNWPGFLSESYQFQFSQFGTSNLLEAISYVIQCFGLADTSDAYLNFFIDEVLNFQTQNNGSISAFLRLWEQHKNKWSLVAPSHSNAIQLLTIHKSKGLEFPIVLYPYANDDIVQVKNKMLWVPLETPDPFPDRVMVKYGRNLEQTNSSTQMVYESEKNQTTLDSLNALYVALTRPEKELYIFCNQVKENDQIKTLPSLFQHFLKQQNLWQSEKELYPFGEQTIGESTKQEKKPPLPFYNFSIQQVQQEFVTKNGQLWDTAQEAAIDSGNLLHHLMSKIYTKKDIPHCLQLARAQGHLNQEQFDFYQKRIEAIVSHPDLAPFFDDKHRIFNERDILLENGKILRPDRLILQNNSASILDYKTGKPHSSYHQQLYEYAAAIESMGYNIAHKILIYSNETLEVNFI
ncbi:MAG: UvrD-helicase domain-containing protein [Flavobacteriaceae bacterium]|nr:UvrD-helicase domain-containing protein [Flavobacteriaceae bacterium]